MQRYISCSIVLYKNKDRELRQLLTTLLDPELDMHVYLVDNSPDNSLEGLLKHPRLEYIFNNANLGYGAGHNIALQKSIARGFTYHIVSNPDIYLSSSAIEHLRSFMDGHRDVGQVMPKICFEDGSLARLCKLLPAPLDLFGRRFLGNRKWISERNKRYELGEFDYNQVLNAPSLSGCFMFLRIETIKLSGLFDTRYFMYMEDFDLVRRIHRHAKTVYYPFVSIMHAHKKESYQSRRMLIIHMVSAIKYFVKWGWFFDKERQRFNKSVLMEIKKQQGLLKDAILAN
jgi:GT2 family glycosyltransferase